jgi:Tol biopolymer transport system component
MIGRRLGPYEIVSPLGAGGMGEVYKARDTRLDRTVAIKILPAAFAADPEVRERFDREARAISSLSHPNICQLFDVGHQVPSTLREPQGRPEQGRGTTGSGQAVDFLVMEYLEGETLSARLEKGALNIDEALQTAIQIASALDAAHRAGIVHRDLKPGNVILTKTGAKLLDFGLAKAQPAVGAGLQTGPSMVQTTPPSLTVRGTILGTFQYMAPEQIEGEDADARTDLFAFGVLLYEMLTGQRAFTGKTQASLLGAILKDEPPPLSTTQPLTTPALDHMVRRCLAKNADERWQTAADVMRELKWIAEGGGSKAGMAPGSAPPVRRMWLMWGLAGLLTGLFIGGAIAGVVVWSRVRGSNQGSTDVVRTLVGIAPADQLQDRSPVEGRLNRTAIAISPDGRFLVFTGVRGGSQRLYLRAFDQLDATPIAGTDGGASPFFSPDGKWVGFQAGGELRKVPAAGGPPVVVCKAPLPFGASWGTDDRIVFSRVNGGLLQVAAAGGAPEELTSLDAAKGEVSHRLPHVLPGGEAVLFTVTRNRFPKWDETQIAVISRRTRAVTVLIEGGADARYVSSGHLIYARQGVLMAAPFDATQMKVTGGSVGLVADVMQAAYELSSANDSGAAQFAVSQNGAMVYVPGGTVPEAARSLSWVDRTGRAEPLPIPPGPFQQPRISPDGRRVAVATIGLKTDIWVFEISRSVFTRLTTEGRNGTPVWTPDSTRLAYRSGIVGPDNLFWRPADGSGAAERLTKSPHHQVPASWSPDGKALVFYDLGQDLTNSTDDLWVVPLSGNRQPQSLVESAFNKGGADISPDGQWLAYHSSESGRSEVYVQPYGRPGARQQISTAGGQSPVWTRNGQELVYVVPAPQAGVGAISMMAAPVTTRPSFGIGAPKRLFDGQYAVNSPARPYDVTTDGQRFLMVQEKERPPVKLTEIILVQNWLEELKRRVPTGH